MTYTRRLLLTVLIVGVVVAFGSLLVNAVWAFLVLFAGILFGIFLHDSSRWISRTAPLPYSWALGLIVLLLVATAAGFLYYLGAGILEQVGELREGLAKAFDQLYQRLRSIPGLHDELPAESPPPQELVPQKAMSYSNVTWAANQVVWFLGALVVIFFVGLYLAADPDRYTTGIVKLVPIPRRGRGREVLHKLHQALAHWIRARLISMSIIGVLTWAGLQWLEVPLALTLGALAALLTFVPNIGPTVALVPQALMALQVSPMTVVYVVLLNLVLQGVESYLVTPLIEQHEVTLPPVLTITMQLALGMLFGVMGVVLAAPLEAVAMVLVQMLYIEDVLEDPSPGDLVVNQTT